MTINLWTVSPCYGYLICVQQTAITIYTKELVIKLAFCHPKNRLVSFNNQFIIYLFVAAQAIFQLSGGCHHYR
jgi:hypothetical protein